MCQDAFDELAGVIGGVEERNGRVVRDGESQDVFMLRRVGVWMQHPARDVGHVESGHEERSRDGEGANVFLNLGFRVEVLYQREFAIGDYI